MRKLEQFPSSQVADGEEVCLTRRAILATLAAAALTACSGTTIITSAAKDAAPADEAGTDDAGTDDAAVSTCTPGTSSAGPVTGFPQGTWKTAAPDYIIGHDANGLFAFSTSCTHQGCAVDPPSSTGATFCPCHGARFDGNDAVLAGPARRPLPHFALTVCEGNVYVDTSTTVAATTRTPAA